MAKARVTDIEVQHAGLAKIFESFADSTIDDRTLAVNSLVKTGLKRDDVEWVMRELRNASSVDMLNPDMTGGCAFRVTGGSVDEGFQAALQSLSNPTPNRPAPVREAISVDID